MLNVITLEAAKSILKQTIAKEGLKFSESEETESLPLSKAGGRILASSIIAADDIPSFTRSTVDGYAVRSADTFGSSHTLPAVLKFDGDIEMGQPAVNPLITGHCQGIPTGGALPEGADAVVMLEDVENIDDGFRYIQKAVSPGHNLIFRGDDIRRDTVLLPAGTCLLAHHIGALAAAGTFQVCVRRQVRAALISTGDELAAASDKLSDGKVYDANAPMIESMLLARGVQVINYGIVKDEYSLLLETSRLAWQKCDLVIISGGSSAGAKDHVSSVITELGNPGLLQHGLAVKPGKPTLIGYADKVPIIGLPGHPVAACLMAQQLLLPLIDWMNTQPTRIASTIKARLLDRIPANHGRQSFIPVRLNRHLQSESDDWSAEPLQVKSGLIASLRDSDGYVVVDRDCEGLNADTDVQVFLWEDC